ncbi:MAG: type II toxin-antitoxin system RelE/ParE family toxin [Planctomycetota bacterium]
MTYLVRIAPTVRAQIEEQIDYYLGEGVSVETALAWAIELDQRFESLEKFPNRFPIDERRTQALGREIRRFEQGSFYVFYRVEDDERIVNVLDIRHTSRRPIAQDSEADDQ